MFYFLGIIYILNKSSLNFKIMNLEINVIPGFYFERMKIEPVVRNFIPKNLREVKPGGKSRVFKKK